MADNMFAEQYVHVGGKQKYTVLVSIVAHTLVIGAAIMVPLVASDAVILPARFSVLALYSQPPVPPAPPPIDVARRSVTVASTAAPVEAPRGITEEIPIQSTSGPLPGIEFNAGLVQGGENVAALLAPPPGPVEPQAPRRPGGDIKRPVKIKDATPAYPAIARAAGVKGVVIIEATIGPNGKVQDARVLRSIPLLDAAALDAVRQWEYTPTLLNGTPIAIVMTVTVDFRLR